MAVVFVINLADAYLDVDTIPRRKNRLGKRR
jgi:hypothetical protein